MTPVSVLWTILLCFIFAPRLVLLSLLAMFLALSTYGGFVEGRRWLCEYEYWTGSPNDALSVER